MKRLVKTKPRAASVEAYACACVLAVCSPCSCSTCYCICDPGYNQESIRSTVSANNTAITRRGVYYIPNSVENMQL